MNVAPGLTCAACDMPFARDLARRTLAGYVHAQPCNSPVVLTGGRWVNRRGVARWVA